MQVREKARVRQLIHTIAAHTSESTPIIPMHSSQPLTLRIAQLKSVWRVREAFSQPTCPLEFASEEAAAKVTSAL